MLLLQSMISVSTLDGIDTFTSGGSTVQQPKVSARQFINRTWMKSGQALVLAGFQQVEADNTTASPLDQHIWGFGGNRSVANTRDALVVVITPVVTRAEATMD
jgi:Flp pilus assembly secretin CpaC